MTIQKRPRFLDVGAPVTSILPITPRSTNYRILNPNDLLDPSIPAGSNGRIHSVDHKANYTVWLLEPRAFMTMQVVIPQHMMSQLLKPSATDHGLFPHLKC
jgi:hypothetical protein